jgi:PAS domain S-box-containing protein
LEEDQETIHLVAKAGSQLDRMEPMLAREGQRPVNKALIIGQAQIMKSTGRNLHHSPGLEPTLDTLFSAVAAFPMRHADCAQGILHVMSSQSSIFDNPEEVDLLQELADDLAYALVNLDAHRQQTLLSSAAETMRDGLFITNFRGDLIYANPALADMLGYNRQDLQNKNIASFMTAEQAAKVWKEYYPALRRRGQFTFETEMPGPQGQSIFSFKASLVRGVKGRGAYIVVNVRDVTRRQMYEHRLLTLNQIATELVQIHDPQQLFHAILVASEELLQADASAIYLINGSFSQITEIYPHNLPEGYASNIQLSSMKFSGSMAAILSQATYVEDASTAYLQPEHASLLADNSYHALATLPIYYEEKPLGGLTLYYKQPHHFEQTEKQLGATVASSLAIALQNAYLYQAEHSQRQLAEALAQATAALNSSLNLEEVLDQILEQTIRVVPCRSVNLMLIKDEHAQVVRQLHRSSSNELQNIASGPTVPLTMPTLQRIISSGQSLLIPDTVQDEMWRTLETTNWCRSYAAAPLKIHEEIIGFLNVNSELPNFFNQETTQHLEAFAANAAAALYNARLYQDLQKHTIELEDRVRERTAELSAAKERIEVILTSVPDAVFVLDENDQLLQANQAGEALLAQAGEKQHDLFNPGFLERLRSGNLPDEKAILEIETRAYQALASPLSLQRDQSGLVIVFRDVTRFRELDEMKTRFVSDVSHELRTPLTNLSLYLDLLADERSDQKRQRYQTTLRRETDRLTQLIEDLLTISRMESNRLSMQMQAVDVDHMARDLAEDRASMASQRGLWLSYTAAPNLPSAMADPRLLTQVLSNLLTNALNYTPPNGKIDLSTYCEHTDTGDWVVMAFRDSGVGISPDELPHIFERFYRGSASRQTGAPGTGLGLAICREIMDRMGGRITVQSEPGRGSTFAIWVKAVL